MPTTRFTMINFARRLTVCLSIIMALLVASPVSAADLPAELTDSGDRATFQWLLEREDKQPHVQRNRRGELEWIGFAGENKYTCSLHLDPQGRVIKLMFNGLGFHNDELTKLAGFRHVQAITCAHNFDENGPNAYKTGPNPVSGAGWIAFKNHPIEFFKIGGCPFDGDGLRAVAQFPRLKELAVFHTRVRDEDLALLEGHPTLEWIHAGPMWSDNITDKALVHMSKMPALKRLKIVETFLSDEGFGPLVERLGDQLTVIELGNTVVPPEDLARLKKSLPQAKIEHDSMAEIGQLIVDNWKGANNKLRKWAPAEVLDAYVAAAVQSQVKPQAE